MASKPITIRWIRTGSQPDWKVMYSIELQTIFYEYKNKKHKINTSFVSPEGPGLLFYNFYFNIRGKLSIIICDKYMIYVFTLPL